MNTTNASAPRTDPTTIPTTGFLELGVLLPGAGLFDGPLDVELELLTLYTGRVLLKIASSSVLLKPPRGDLVVAPPEELQRMSMNLCNERSITYLPPTT